MNSAEIYREIERKSSFLCVGLDTDWDRIPAFLKKFKDPIFEFNKRIIDATHKYCVAYKPNTAFYESRGAAGWEALAKTIEYIPKECLVIADAKRGDIGNTSRQYAKAFFEDLKADAVTVAPYMGKDSVGPFLEFEDKWVVLLALTSNPSAADFELLGLKDTDERLFEKVLRTSKEWGTVDQLMYVVGATKAEALMGIRKIIPNHFLLVPGVGAQGGSLQQVAQFGMNASCGLLVNSSRGIIFADDSEDFAASAGKVAQKMAREMAGYLDRYLA